MVICLVSIGSLLAQDRYMVFFRDKENSTYTVSSPLEFLSQRALDRRAKHSVRVTVEDFPVNASYVQELSATGAVVYFTSRWMNAALVEMPKRLKASVRSLTSVDSLAFVAPGSKLSFVREEFTVTDTFTDPSTIVASTDDQIKMLSADRLQADGYQGSGMLIAVFDGGFSGVNLRSPFRQIHDEGRVLAALDFIRNSGNPYQYGGHGTSVLSCIGGSYTDGINTFIGTAPKASFILAVTEDVGSEYRVEEYNWLFAAEYADSAGVDVINSSLGYTEFDDPDMDYSYEDMDGATTVITRAANFAASKGMLVVTSAGNSGNITLQACLNAGGYCYISAPADSPNVLSVGAVGVDRMRALFSSFGPSFDGRKKPDIAAMGLRTVIVTSRGNITTQGNGTSFSSPMMAGFATSLWQKYPDLTNVELMDLIKNSGTQSDDPDNELGYGIPSYLVIIGEPRFEKPLKVSDEVEKIFKIYPNPTKWSLTIERPANREITYQLTTLEGEAVAKGVLEVKDTQIKINPLLRSGIYFLRLASGSNVETIKLLKK